MVKMHFFNAHVQSSDPCEANSLPNVIKMTSIIDNRFVNNATDFCLYQMNIDDATAQASRPSNIRYHLKLDLKSNPKPFCPYL